MNGAISIQGGYAVSVLDEALGAQRRLWPHYPLEMVGGFDRRWRPAEKFFADHGSIEELLVLQDKALPGLDRKGKAAFAIGAYSYALAAGLVPLFVGFRVVPDFSASNLAVAFAPAGPSRLRFALTRTNIATDAASPHPNGSDVLEMSSAALRDRFSAQLEEHICPLIESLHLATRLGRAALWRLVADYFAQLFLDAGDQFHRTRRSQADAMGILKRARSSLSNPQLHFFDLAEENRAIKPCRSELRRTFVSRGGCCRQYTVDGYELCATCVLQNPEARDIEIRKQLRAAAGLEMAEHGLPRG